jgi:hypothetical protein
METVSSRKYAYSSPTAADKEKFKRDDVLIHDELPRWTFQFQSAMHSILGATADLYHDGSRLSIAHCMDVIDDRDKDRISQLGTAAAMVIGTNDSIQRVLRIGRENLTTLPSENIALLRSFNAVATTLHGQITTKILPIIIAKQQLHRREGNIFTRNVVSFLQDAANTLGEIMRETSICVKWHPHAMPHRAVA